MFQQNEQGKVLSVDVAILRLTACPFSKKIGTFLCGVFFLPQEFLNKTNPCFTKLKFFNILSDSLFFYTSLFSKFSIFSKSAPSIVVLSIFQNCISLDNDAYILIRQILQLLKKNMKLKLASLFPDPGTTIWIIFTT